MFRRCCSWAGRRSFENRLYGLDTNQYRVDAAYIGPDGGTLGSVDDIQTIKQTRTARDLQRARRQFGGRSLSARPIHRQLLPQWPILRAAPIHASSPMPACPITAAVSSGGGSGVAGASCQCRRPRRDRNADARHGHHRRYRRPAAACRWNCGCVRNPTAFCTAKWSVHLAGYGATPIEGFVRGEHLQFQVPYGGETYYFEGQRERDELSGTFESTPSGERGTWTTHA